MRIVIDIQGMQNLSASRGIGRYVTSLTQAILQNSKEDEIFLLLNGLFPQTIDPIIKQFEGLLPKHHFVVFDAYKGHALAEENALKVAASELCREKLIADLNPDFLILTSLFEGAMDNSITSIGKFSHIPTAVVLYDLIPHILKEKYLSFEPLEKWYYEKIDSLKKADLLLAISESAKQEAVEHLQIDADKIINISSAVDAQLFQPQKEQNDVRNKYNITKEFLLYTSAYEQRKNFEGLMEAFSLLAPAIREKLQLVLVCKLNDEKKNQLLSAAKRLHLRNDECILTDYIPDEELIHLYSSCTLFVFPSLHEGFGLPALEAMSCGAATIGSNTTSIPEVIGRDDALFDPYDAQSIAKKIEEVLTKKDFLHALKKHAQIHAKKFTWEKSAEATLKALEARAASQKEPQNLKTNTAKLIKKIALLPSKEKLTENDLVHIANIIAKNEKTIQRLQAYADFSQPLRWRVEGPFDSSYSLALLNRETARALDELGHTVILHSTEGPGDFLPDKSFLEANRDLKEMYEREAHFPPEAVDVMSRNLYPPRVEDMKAKKNMLHHYAWEESAFPQEWVEKFNTHLDSMTCLSKHVEKIMIDNGVKVPLITSGCGVDHWQRVEADTEYILDDKHSFRFLHVSSCFPRKGVDVLLQAYGDAFEGKDDVILIIKTFPNPHNEVHKWLQEAKKQHAAYPDILIIEEDLSEEQLKALYKQCDALVAPSRAEGFGVPLAEAMLSDLAVITTGWGGQLDFCSDATAWLIEYEFTPAQTHFKLFNSVWAEPSRNHLAQLMQEVYKTPLKQRLQKTSKAKEFLLENSTWLHVSERLVDMALATQTDRQERRLKLAWISSYNTKCGIATYSQHLIENMHNADVEVFCNYAESTLCQDKSNVQRCFALGDEETLQALSKKVYHSKPDAIVIQFNYGFFNFTSLGNFIEEYTQQGKKIIVMLHATQDPISAPHKKLSQLIPSFQKCARVLVHSYKDLNRLKAYGLIENVALFPHGVLDFKPPKKAAKNSVFTLASYGFFLPHKGLLELIEAVAILHRQGIELHLNMFNAKYPDPVSDDMIQKAKEKIATLNMHKHITLNTNYLSDEESLIELNKADLLLFVYQETGESSSAAVRYGLAAQKPIAVTPLDIFDDVKDAVFRLNGTSPHDIAAGIQELMGQIKANAPQIEQKQEEAKRWRTEHRYSHLAQRLSNIIEALTLT